MKIYVGVRTEDGAQVTIRDYIEDPQTPRSGFFRVDQRPLEPRFDLRNHSPTGFEWGYGGSGPAQLALALCADALGDDELAQRVYQQFKFKVVAGLDRNKWSMTDDEIRVAISAIVRADARESLTKEQS